MKPQRESRHSRVFTRSARAHTRQRTPTLRGQEYERLSQFGDRFPTVGDEIVVKWEVDSGSVWWPATVLSSSPRTSRRCEGTLLYHKLRDYPPSEAAVIFTALSATERLVTSVGSGTDASSWMFSYEHPKERSSKRSDGPSLPSSAANLVAPCDTVRRDGPSPPSSVASEAPPTNNEDLHRRLAMIERQLKDANTPASSSFSSSAQSFIVSLRWSLLSLLEKPLKPLNLDGLSNFGIAHQELSVTVQCDYNTFKEIASALESEHACTSNKPNSTRVAFSPPFYTTQNGSTAADNLNIMFATLSDLTTFLRIRDDKDFESLLSKEVVTETTTILRILGTFRVKSSNEACEPDGGNGKSIGTSGRNGDASKTAGPSTEKSEESVCTLSERVSTISLFVGTAPVAYTTATVAGGNGSEGGRPPASHTSTLFQQECKY